MYEVRNVETRIIANDRARDEYSVSKSRVTRRKTEHGGKQSSLAKSVISWLERERDLKTTNTLLTVGSRRFNQAGPVALCSFSKASNRERIGRVWIRIRCTLLRGVARPYVTTHVPGFCGRGMPRRRFVWIGGYPPMDGGPADCYSGRRPSGSFRLISYETRRDRLITVEFVAQLYRRPLRPRMNAAIVLETRASVSSSFRRSEEDVSSARRTDESGVTLVTWKLEQGPRLARLIATAFFGDDSAPRSSSLIGSFPLRRRSRSRKRCSRSAYWVIRGDWQSDELAINW